MKALTQTQPGTSTKLDATKQKVDRLFSLNKISPQDLEGLSPLERQYVGETCTSILQNLRGDERDKFLDKIDLLMSPATKSDIWNQNHLAINTALAEHIGQNGFMPPINTIAAETGLSRQTVAKHIKEYKKQPEFAVQMEQFQFMTPAILARIFKFALNGNMRAAKLYFEMVGAVPNQASNTVVNAQNNNIQINNTILSQENLSRLTSDQLAQIEHIIAGQKG